MIYLHFNENNNFKIFLASRFSITFFFSTFFCVHFFFGNNKASQPIFKYFFSVLFYCVHFFMQVFFKKVTQKKVFIKISKKLTG
jgi:lipopolysaccharide export LptBFGC system permease protein LptF